VLAWYEAEKASGARAIWQVGNTIFDPAGRVIWRDDRRDLVFLQISPTEARECGYSDDESEPDWAGTGVAVGDFVAISGYPAYLREHPTGTSIEFNALSAVFRVTTVGVGYAMCQWQREYLVAFQEPGVPSPGVDLGGMSGGPALHLARPGNPVIGVISEFHRTFELLRISTFDGVAEPHAR
jgi:hypothetical protein